MDQEKYIQALRKDLDVATVELAQAKRDVQRLTERVNAIVGTLRSNAASVDSWLRDETV